MERTHHTPRRPCSMLKRVALCQSDLSQGDELCGADF